MTEVSKKAKNRRSSGISGKISGKSPKDEDKTLIKHREGQKWYSYQFHEKLDGVQDLDEPTQRQLFQEAEEYYNQEVRNYVREAQKLGSEASWLFTVLKKGTAQDKMSAVQLQAHNSPVHSLAYLQFMIESVEEKKIRDALQFIPILEDVFLNAYLPQDRKLVTFSARPLSSLSQLSKNDAVQRRKLLILWMFEHQLKLTYEKFIRALGNCAGGNVEDLNKKSLKTALNLLAERPEGEQILLSMLVNKLGHPNYKIGTFTESLIEELARKQPAMRSVIVREIERLIYRKNISPQAILYAVTALSQFALRRGESELATQLLTIYFGLFKSLVSEGKIEPKLLNILLTAANRAFPYAAEKAESLVDDIDALYRLVHTATYNIALHTLRLLFQFHQLSESLSDRFFTALYRKLLDPCPPSAYNQLLVLIYKALKVDTQADRVRTFVKRLLQIATTASPPFATGILILVSKTMEARQDKSLVVLRREPERNPVLLNGNENGEEEDEERYVDVDDDETANSLATVGKSSAAKSSVKKEEPDSEESDGEKKDVKPTKKELVGANNSAGWVHRSAKGRMRDPYDPAARNPLFVSCNQIADNELYILSKHYHPSVAAFAKSLIEKGVINYRGDPLTDFSLMHFLDRFAFRNPKSKKKPKDEKVIKKKAYDPWGVRGMSVKSTEYLTKSESELPADERFLHRYAKSNIRMPEKQQEKEDEWETRSVDSEEFETLLERFETGEKNEEFLDEIDYGEAFSAEKKRKKDTQKRKADADDVDAIDEDELEDEEMSEGDDDEELSGDSEGSDDDIEEENDSDDADDVFIRPGKQEEEDWQMDSDADDNNPEMDEDANLAGEMFANLLDEHQEEEKQMAKRQKRNKSAKHKKTKNNAAKRRR